MPVYLHDIPLPEALSRFRQALADAGLDGLLGVEEIPLDERAAGRVLAENAWAGISSPHYHAAAMDGFAVRTADTEGAAPSAPRTLIVGPAAEYVDTGDPLPAWADAVIPVEDIEPLDAAEAITPDVRRPDRIRIRAGTAPWSHVRPMGEDIVATQLILPAGHLLRPADLAALAAGGMAALRVARRPRVAVLPTGDELVAVGRSPRPGEIIELNSMMLAAQVNGWGGEASRLPITPDDFDQLCERVSQAAEYDLVLLNAGSSAGSEDYSSRVIEMLGSVLVHGVAVRPGHPVILGMIRRPEGATRTSAWTPVIGVPGYPVSAALTGEIFIRPLIRRWLGQQEPEAATTPAELTR
ncbi:MAG TPA: molybdopterin-binding protein, partial [Anaerolineaceae bacterium]